MSKRSAGGKADNPCLLCGGLSMEGAPDTGNVDVARRRERCPGAKPSELPVTVVSRVEHDAGALVC